MAMLGAGVMAPDQVAAVRAIRPIERLLVWSRTGERAEALAAQVVVDPGPALQLQVEVVESPTTAVAEADVVTCATPATAPLFGADAVRPGAHVNAIGSFRPEMVEIPAALLHDAWVIVDDRKATAVEAGDLLQAGREPDGEMSDLLAGRIAQPPGKTTVYKSCGVAGMDVAAAVAALR
jgi:ornithine cyclodeaminase